jgi:hypothetical protein
MKATHQRYGHEVEVELVYGDDREGIAEGDGRAYAMWRGEAVPREDGDTWYCPSGGHWVVKDGTWVEVDNG